MSRYAEHTTVPVDRSRAEIERTLARYGCNDFAYRSRGEEATIAFTLSDRCVRFDVTLPSRTDEAFTIEPRRGRARTETAALTAWEQACRQKWRALALCIKAKLEAVDAGISTFENEFLAHIVIPDGRGQTVGQWIQPQLLQAYEEHGPVPLLLEDGRGKRR